MSQCRRNDPRDTNMEAAAFSSTGAIRITDALQVDELVRRAMDGDADAFDRLYRDNVGRIYALCLRMSADRMEAERLTQDVFIRCWERLDSFRGDSRFSTWLHRLAVNLVLNDRRSTGRREQRVTGVADLGRYGAEAGGSQPDKKIDLERAIATLPDAARHAFVLYAVEGYRYREIADMTNTALGTVKAQIHRARQLLKERLEM